MDSDLASVAIADDGELEDVRRLLGRLGAPFHDAWTGEAREAALRISNGRRALEDAAAARGDDGEFHIVILDETSAELRRGLKGGHFDFIVQRPVHSSALRLLILHALYSGPEKRCNPRVAMEAEVQIRSGLIPRSARMTQLSEKGCGLLVDRSFDVGERVTVAFPADLTRKSSLSMEGRVVACVPADDGQGKEQELAVVFRPPSAEVRAALRTVMASNGVGAASLRPKRAKAPTRKTGSRSPKSSSPRDRRGAERKSYRRPVMASARGGVHTLIGRDLSTSGMRVAADERLKAGEEFKLVIYGQAGRGPVLVKAVVVRNDGADGCALRFREVNESIAASLEDMVGTLPQLGAGGAANVVLSEIVEEPEARRK